MWASILSIPLLLVAPPLLLSYALTGTSALSSQGELAISYSVPSTAVVLHAPVVLRFHAHNNSQAPAQLDLGKNREENFEITYTGPGVGTPKTVRRQTPGFGVSGPIQVAPNTTFEKDILLNRWVSFSTPGTYDIEIKLVQNTAQGAAVEAFRFRASVEILAPDPKRLTEVCSTLAARLVVASSYDEAATAALELSLVRDTIAVPYLEQALYARKLVEPIAIEGLEQIGGQEAAKVLIGALSRTSSDVASIARAALERIATRTSDTELKTLIRQALETTHTSPSSSVR